MGRLLHGPCSVVAPEPGQRTGDGPARSAPLFDLAKNSAVKARTQAIYQLKAVVVIADPALRERLSKGRRELFRSARLSPLDGEDAGGDGDTVAHVTRIALSAPAQHIEQLTGQIDELIQCLTGLVERPAPLLIPAGISMGDNPARLNTEAFFAALCGVSSVECSSGWRSSRRLDCGGDRRADAVLHRIAFTQLRFDPRIQSYDERRTREGKTRREIIRCLERYAAREVFNLVRTVSTDPPLSAHPVIACGAARPARNRSEGDLGASP
ncbi:transposase [Streptomyces sp. NPDC047461]|uniref:transposase n=1 Tax=Streptomyces sp. NPDC047461 TaxID=3155619 RepID=UPI0033C13A4A